MIIISRKEFNEAMGAYKKIVNEMPEELSSHFTIFEEFLHGSCYHLGWFHNYDKVQVSADAYKKIEMLNSPHARTLLTAWAIQHLSSNDNEKLK